MKLDVIYRGHCDTALCSQNKYISFLNDRFCELVISRETKNKIHFHFLGVLRSPLKQRVMRSDFATYISPSKCGDDHHTYSFSNIWGSKSSPEEHLNQYKRYICIS